MIFGALLNSVTAFLNFIVGVLPAYPGMPTGVVTAVSFFGGQIPVVCGYVSGVCTAFNQILAIVFPVVLGLVLFKITSWVFHWKQAK